MTSSFPFYPSNDFGPLMKGLIIGGLGIFHVFLAQFAIGGGWLMCYFQWLAQTQREPLARQFLDGFFRVLVLISFVLGALTGVGMWFTTIQISARTIGVMIDQFHWVWAIEWTFFCLEIVAGYAFYRCGPQLTDRARMRLLLLYAFAAWMSLFWINGILSWQLTPGQWTYTGSVWDGFFNPSFWPSLFFRTFAAFTIAGLAAMVVINAMPGLDRASRTRLINRAAHFLAGMVLMPLFGGWFFSVLPRDSQQWLTGGSVAMTMFFTLAVGCSVLIGGYAVIGLLRQKLYINGATATLLLALGFGATAGGEFVREGVRKPFTIRHQLYSNAIRPDQVALLRIQGSVTDDPYPLRDGDLLPTEQLRTGAKVFRLQCLICHTPEGVNGLTHLTGSWTLDMKRQNIAKLQRLKPFMPPFAGSPEELEAVVQWITWIDAGRPPSWADSSAQPDFTQVRAQLQKWLDEAGTLPMSPPPPGGAEGAPPPVRISQAISRPQEVTP